MNPTAWPQSAGFSIGDIPVALRFAANPGNFRPAFYIVLLVALFTVGLFIPIPGTTHVSSGAYDWWFLALLDSLVTGGALGRGGVLGMGLIAPVVLGSRARMKNGFPEFVLRYTVGLGLVASILVFTLRVRGVVGPGARQFATAVFWMACGGIAVKGINALLLRFRGPSPFYINLLVSIAVSVRGSVGQLLASRQYAPLYILALSSVFIALSAVYLLKRRIRIEVTSLKQADAHRTAQLEIAPIDEFLLDSIGMMCLILYLCLGGFVSLVFGWRTLTPGNYPVFLGISALAFFLVWWSFSTINRYRNVVRVVDITGMLRLTDPRGYALRMLNNFWIIPGTRAGLDTEQYIARRLAATLRTSFILLASWVAVAVALQYVAARNGFATVLLPYGPLVFVFTVVMIVGNLSMVLSNIGGSMNHLRQSLRGQSRVIADTYPLGLPKTSKLTMGADLKAYWEEEKISDQLDEVVDWLKLARDVQLWQPKTARDRTSFASHLQKWAANFLVGVIVCFVAGALCLFFWPDTSQRDLGIMAVPLLVSSLFAPDAILRMVKVMLRR